jgi:hypothetical protein
MTVQIGIKHVWRAQCHVEERQTLVVAQSWKKKKELCAVGFENGFVPDE